MLFSSREGYSLLCKVKRVGAFHFIWSEAGLSQSWVAVFWAFVLLSSSGSPFLLKCSPNMPSTESLVCLHVPLPGGSSTPILINRFLALCPSQSQSLLNILKGQQLNVSLSFPPLPSHPDFGQSGLPFWLFGSLTWRLKTPLISLHSVGIGPQGLSRVTESGMCRWSRGIDVSSLFAAVPSQNSALWSLSHPQLPVALQRCLLRCVCLFSPVLLGRSAHLPLATSPYPSVLSGDLPRLFPESFWPDPVAFDSFPIFWWGQMFHAPLVNFLSRTWHQPFFQGCLIPFIANGC